MFHELGRDCKTRTASKDHEWEWGFLGLCFGQRGSDELTGERGDGEWRPHVQGPREDLLCSCCARPGTVTWTIAMMIVKEVPCMEAAIWRPKNKDRTSCIKLDRSCATPKKVQEKLPSWPRQARASQSKLLSRYSTTHYRPVWST